MPRNGQVTRDFYLVQDLENSRGATLQGLAVAVPEDYSRHLHTIRRNLEALELSVRIEWHPGQWLECLKGGRLRTRL